jgi:hypothetical protein
MVLQTISNPRSCLSAALFQGSSCPCSLPLWDRNPSRAAPEVAADRNREAGKQPDIQLGDPPSFDPSIYNDCLTILTR